MAKKTKGNREYKSDVFSMLMEEPKNALEVYNALNNSNYTDPEVVEIITTDHGISLSIRNDASFLIDRDINYYEHQSTYSPNMPLRCLIYYVNDIEKYVKYDKKDLYSGKIIQLPTPHFVVFYNGQRKRDEVEVMRLSAAFYNKTEEPKLEVICTAYNINPDFNKELKERATVLFEYTVFVETVRKYAGDESNPDKLETAIDKAIDKCIEENILRDFLLKRRDEVTKVTKLDFTFETREKYIRRDAFEDGKEEGLREGLEQGREEERANTMQEKARADALQAEVERLKAQIAKLEET